MLYPGQDAVNHKLWWTDGVMKFVGISTEPRRIIAVVPDFDDENIIPSSAMTIYEPSEQEQGWSGRPVRTRTSGSLHAGPRHHTNHSPAVGRPARGKGQHAGRRSRRGADARPAQRDCVWRIRRRGAFDLRSGCGGCSCFLCERAYARVRSPHGAGRYAAQYSHVPTVLVEGVAMAGIGVGAGVVVGFALSRVIAKYV